jgi:predicted transcriptional regulator
MEKKAEKKDAKMVQKWGETTLTLGWTAIPTTLIFLQERFGITPLGMNIILNLVAHWWDAKENPYPAQESLASRIGVSKRSIQREMASLIERGLLSKKQSSTHHPKYHGRNSYDLSPLVKMLQEQSPPLIASMKKKKTEVAASRSAVKNDREGETSSGVFAGSKGDEGSVLAD